MSTEHDRDLPDFLQDDIEPVRPLRARMIASGTGRAVSDSTVEPGLWVFILGDMTLFGAFFCGFAWQAHVDPALFRASAGELLIGIGGINTLVLLTSSLFVVAAVRAMKAAAHRVAAQALMATLACALLFAGLKISEYVAEVGAGHTPGSNAFFTYYFVLTGIHLLHVLIGVVLLASAWRGLRSPTPSVSPRFVEGAGVYWHMVDLLWVVLFPLLYISSL